MSSPRARFQRLAWTVALAAAVLLKAAVPFLAAGAAAAQGLPVGEICSVYGVRTADALLSQAGASDAAHGHHHQQADADAPGGPQPAPHDAPGALAQHGGHCALGALGAFAPPPPAAVAPLAAGVTAPDAVADGTGARAPDATARWSALRKQGPPGTG